MNFQELKEVIQNLEFSDRLSLIEKIQLSEIFEAKLRSDRPRRKRKSL